MIKIKKSENILDQYMPSFKKINNFFETGFKNLQALNNSLSVFVKLEETKNYSQNVTKTNHNALNEMNYYKNIFEDEIKIANPLSQITNEKTNKKTTVNNSLNEYRNREKVLDNTSKNVEIKFDMSGMQNHINTATDIDDFIAQFTEKLENAMNSSASGVHV